MGRARLAPSAPPVSRAAIYLRVSTGRQAEHDLCFAKLSLTSIECGLFRRSDNTPKLHRVNGSSTEVMVVILSTLSIAYRKSPSGVSF